MSSFDREGSRRVQREPLAFAADGLEFSVEGYNLDDDEGEPFEVDSDDPISLEQWADEWDTLTLEGTLTVAEDLEEAVFPPGERSDPPGEVILATECDRTHLRRGHEVGVDDFSEGTHTVELTVERGDYYGQFTVRPLLVRTSSGAESDVYRTVPGSALADGPETVVVVDELERESDVLLPSQFKSFADSDSDRFPEDALYVVQHADPERPKLFVNSDHEEVKTALTSGPRGYLGKAMQVFRSSITLPPHLDLILWTAESVDETGEVQHDWQETVLEEFVTEMYDTSDRTEAGKQLHEHFDGSGSVTELLDEASVTLQRRFSVEESMTGLVETLRR